MFLLRQITCLFADTDKKINKKQRHCPLIIGVRERDTNIEYDVLFQLEEEMIVQKLTFKVLATQQ